MMNLSVNRTGRAKRVIIAIIGCVIWVALSGFRSDAADAVAKTEIDPASGLIIAQDWKLVLAMCSSCHSPKLITNYGGTRETWESLIDWMQKTQGLWPIERSTEDKILTYLATNYPPGEVSRRRNLPISMRPPNPYVSKVKAGYEAKREKGEIAEPSRKER